MPNLTVMIGTVAFASEPDDMDQRENSAKPAMTLRFDRGTRLPRVGDRVAVAYSVDAIFKWMESLPAKRIVDAAREWADMVDRIVVGGRDNLKRPEQRALYDAVRAAGTPSEDETYEPPVIRDRALTGFDTAKGADRSATIITITITEGA